MLNIYELYTKQENEKKINRNRCVIDTASSAFVVISVLGGKKGVATLLRAKAINYKREDIWAIAKYRVKSVDDKKEKNHILPVKREEKWRLIK